MTVDNFKEIIMNHEKRISRLEAEIHNINGWVKNIDKRLKNIETLSVSMNTSLEIIKKKFDNNNYGMSRNKFITIIGTQAVIISTMLTIILRLMGGG